MAYAGQVPWHGLGQKVEADASIEEWMAQANMEWEIKNSPVMYQNGEMHEAPEYRVLYRSDTNAHLSVVSDRYKVVQPKQMMEFFRSLVDAEGFTIETLGSLKGGRRIWALAKTNIEDTIRGGDLIKGYLLLITSCDGSLATTAKFISTRVVCWNTQAIALGEAGQEVRVRHNTTFDANAVKGQMGLIGRVAFNGFIDRMRNLASVNLSTHDAKSALGLILPAPTGAKELEETKGFRKILDLFQGGAMGSNLPGVAGTAWGFLNAVTEYTDHHIRARTTENRLDSAWFGAGANLKATAEEVLLTL
ncbi:conserved hypothetical protein (plasmid) [Polaromonas naphthalenivorans CJ2]|uniref:Phage/plasmid-related protein TIGR03299 n=2 Tax=Polaromonas naphthalenivorans TaxID=216465 RepID=A1VVA8_POLNA|nr:conserved hypothetical protein [Polaromonas naphthalenivorans CJ2]